MLFTFFVSVGRHPQTRRDAHSIDPASALVRRIFQRVRRTLRSREYVPQSPILYLHRSRIRLPVAFGVGICVLATGPRRADGAGSARGGVTLMATLIFFLSAAALLQFFISYCLSLLSSSIKQPPSAQVG